MSSTDKILFLFFTLIILWQCNDPYHLSKKYEQASLSIVGKESCTNIRVALKDSIATWVLNGFIQVEAEATYPYEIDSLLCFNTAGDRFITCRHLYVNIPNASADEIAFLFGEKIDSKWYFYRGPSIVVPRSMSKNHDDDSKPLSYRELHEIALKEVYSGYLTATGSISEDWFKNYFENVGVCAECKTREDFQKNIVASAAAIWSTRDTTKPIIRLKEKLP